jgi:hypothetical protein
MATFSLAFHGLMRVGELTVGNKSSDTQPFNTLNHFTNDKFLSSVLKVVYLVVKTQTRDITRNSGMRQIQSVHVSNKTK